MGFRLSAKSLAELAGVHPDLAAVVRRAIELTPQDFAVHDGIRTAAEQRQHVASGASQTLASKHLPQLDGFGHAVDLVPYAAGKLRWEWPLIYPVAVAVRAAAIERGVRLRWGGVWDRVLNDLPGAEAGLEDAVEGYAARRREAGKKAFLDGPHYELVAP